MANYELMVILDGLSTQEERDASLAEVKELFTKNNVKIEKEDVWWEKKLAYKINRSERGFYILFDLEMDWKLIKTFTKTLNLNKPLLRFMFVKKEA